MLKTKLALLEKILEARLPPFILFLKTSTKRPERRRRMRRKEVRAGISFSVFHDTQVISNPLDL